MSELPRPTFKTEADTVAELTVADVVAQWANAQYLKIGKDDPDQEKPRIDGLLYRDGRVVVFLEIKSRSCRFGAYPDGWIISEKKVIALRSLHNIVRVPVVLIINFACGTIAYVNTAEIYRRVERFGRFDRNSPGDIETGACYAWQQLKAIRKAQA